MSKELRCIHRHTISEHPGCFAKGLIKQNPMAEVSPVANEWYKQQGTRIGYLDIESDGLKADFATMLTWAIKEKGGDIRSDFITKKELFNGIVDRRIVESCVEELRNYDIIVTYYGTGFDLPFLRTKALHYQIDFPGYIVELKELKDGSTSQRYVPELCHWDLYYTVKSKLNLSRKSLDNACDYLGIKGKTPLERSTWRLAKYGDPAAIQEVLVHNMQDVKILEQLHDRLEFARKWIKSGI